MNKAILLATLASGLLLAGCSNQPDEYDVDGWSSVANPASLYCVQKGAKLETITENNSRVTYCVFSEDDKVEQWQYYRDHHKDDEKTPAAKS